MKNNLRNLNFKEILTKIEALFFDVDGVLSDSKILIGDTGELQRTTNVKDGYAIKYALRKGLKIFIISGGLNVAVKKRFENLGVNEVVIGSKTKKVDFERIIKENNLTYDNVLFMGDDIPDYEIMNKVGLACCPADAVSEIKNISLFISEKKGGEGCARDIIEQILRAQGKWMDSDSYQT